MNTSWGILFALVIVAFAFFIKHFVDEVIEEDHHFWGILAFYFILYTAAAIGIAYVSPQFTADASTLDGSASDTVDVTAVHADAPRSAWDAFIDKIAVKNVLP